MSDVQPGPNCGYHHKRQLNGIYCYHVSPSSPAPAQPGAFFYCAARAVDHATLRAICRAVDIPVIAIGGITRDNVTSLAGTGIVGIAVISAIFAQEDVRAAAADLLVQTKKAVG